MKPTAARARKPGKYDMKSIRRGELSADCKQCGRRKEGVNLIWKQSRGRLSAGCRFCGNRSSNEYQWRKQEAKRKLVPNPRDLRGFVREALPLDRYSMLTLVTLYQLGDGEWRTADIAKATRILLDSQRTFLSRLRAKGFVSSTKGWEAKPATAKKNKLVAVAYHELTDDGFTLANAWIAFLVALGPVTKRIRWATP